MSGGKCKILCGRYDKTIEMWLIYHKFSRLPANTGELGAVYLR